jgi:hypothetical protein
VTVEDRVSGDGSFEVISKLSLVNVTWVDSGQYQCIGQGLGVVYSVKANVTVHSKLMLSRAKAYLLIRNWRELLFNTYSQISSQSIPPL